MRGQGSGEYLALLGAGAVVAIIVVSGILSLTTQVLPSQFEVAQQQCARFSNTDCNQQHFEIENQNYECQWGNNHCEAQLVTPLASTCLNNVQEENEVCDGTDLDGKTCLDFSVFTSGTLQCNNTCTGFNFSRCTIEENPVCGNGIIEETETCDDNNTNNEDGCSSSCSIENEWNCAGAPSICVHNPVCGDRDGTCLSNCTNPPDPDCLVTLVCGNNLREGIEACDGSDLNNQTCQTKGFESGTLRCFRSGSANECQWDTRACTTASQSAVLTFWGPSLDVPTDESWVNDYLPTFAELKQFGFSHVGIHPPFFSLDPAMPSIYWNRYNNRVAELRSRNFDVTLHFSPGRILKDPTQLDPLTNANGQNAKYFDSADFVAGTCSNSAYSESCGLDTGFPYDPAYRGVVWQKELQLLQADIQRANITAADLVLFDQEIWGGNWGWCEYGILWNDGEHEKTSGFYLNGPFPHLLENSTGRYSGPQGQPAYVQEKQFVGFVRDRMQDLKQTVKQFSPETPVLFYGENPRYNPTAAQTCFRYPLCPCAIIEGEQVCPMERNNCPVDETTYVPVGSGDAASPSIYLLPDLTALQTQLTKGDYSGSFVWINFSVNGIRFQRWDPKITQKAGKLLRGAGVDGIIVYPGPFEQDIPIEEYKIQSNALANGFLRNQDPGELLEVCGDEMDNDGDGFADENNCQNENDFFVSCENGVCDPNETVDSCPIDCQPSTGLQELPNFAVVLSSTQIFKPYLQATTNQNQWSFSDDFVDATIRRLPNDFWKLEITPKTDLDGVYFPWRPQRFAINGSTTDDIVFYPYLGGVFEKEGSHADFEWWGLEYPGSFFAPWVIISDDVEAQITAATNWPPKHVIPQHANQQTAFFYPDVLRANTLYSFVILLSTVQGNKATGFAPWQLALKKYKDWLNESAPQPSYSVWLKQSEGFLNVQLENSAQFENGVPVSFLDLTSLRSLWNQWKKGGRFDFFNWIQFWGQMSNYAESCCGFDSSIHSRYLSSGNNLVNWVQQETAMGLRAGYYSREPPSSISPSGRLDNPAGAAFLRQWGARNREEYHANAFYIDVIGRSFVGKPEALLPLFSDGTIPQDSITEGYTDFFPRASLLSGYLKGNTDGAFQGGPGITPSTRNSGTFISLSRFLMGNRIGFLGESNTDWVLFGATANHWLERQLFLLGAKADVMHPEENGVPNPVLLRIKELRDRVHWWNYDPVYLDTLGLTQVPAGMDARRFRTNTNQDWVVIDNPEQLAGQFLLLKGKRVNISSDSLSIIVVN